MLVLVLVLVLLGVVDEVLNDSHNSIMYCMKANVCNLLSRKRLYLIGLSGHQRDMSYRLFFVPIIDGILAQCELDI